MTNLHTLLADGAVTLFPILFRDRAAVETINK